MNLKLGSSENFNAIFSVIFFIRILFVNSQTELFMVTCYLLSRVEKCWPKCNSFDYTLVRTGIHVAKCNSTHSLVYLIFHLNKLWIDNPL
jgi:hypothetical protein